MSLLTLGGMQTIDTLNQLRAKEQAEEGGLKPSHRVQLVHMIGMNDSSLAGRKSHCNHAGGTLSEAFLLPQPTLTKMRRMKMGLSSIGKALPCLIRDT